VLPELIGHLSDPFLAEMLDSIAIELAEHDWDLIVAAVPSGHDERDVTDRLIRAGKVGGFVLTRARRRDRRIDFLREAGVPFVVHGRSEDCTDYAWLDIDNEKAFVDAVGYLIDIGHTRIAHIGGDQAFNFAFFRRRGYESAMATAGLPVPPDYTADGAVDAASGELGMADMLALAEPPTAVVCVTDIVALGAMRAITRAGLRPGREVSVIGYDGLPIGLAADPPLTTMSQSSHDAGRELARTVMALTRGADPTASQTLWEAKLMQRASTNPPPT
ncbi:MAG: substrate-binding domain-containing protein, partial [Hyphomicrobiales bacterium]|nr:substrate-binding domain-containing protein [Hyphomicrobiales bacterium]